MEVNVGPRSAMQPPSRPNEAPRGGGGGRVADAADGSRYSDRDARDAHLDRHRSHRADGRDANGGDDRNARRSAHPDRLAAHDAPSDRGGRDRPRPTDHRAPPDEGPKQRIENTHMAAAEQLNKELVDSYQRTGRVPAIFNLIKKCYPGQCSFWNGNEHSCKYGFSCNNASSHSLGKSTRAYEVRPAVEA